MRGGSVASHQSTSTLKWTVRLCGRGAEPSPWQIDGMVYDLGSSIQRVELKGCCPRDVWNQLLSVLNYPAQSLVAYDLQSAKFVPVEQLESQLWSC